MVAMRIFPWMLIVVIHSIVVWTCIAGLLGEYLIPCCFAFACATYSLQQFANKNLISYLLIACFLSNLGMVAIATFEKSINSLIPGILALGSILPAMFVIVATKHMNQKKIQAWGSFKRNYFAIKSALTATWLPCVVGNKPYTFLISAVSSLVFKNFLFLVAILLNYYKAIHVNVFLFWCVDSAEMGLYKERTLTPCYSMQSCFDFSKRNSTEQKIRVCHESQNDDFVMVYIYVLLYFMSLSSGIAVVTLDKLTDFEEFYKSTRTFLGFPTNPVVHRSLVFTLACSGENPDLLEKVADDTEMINRPRRGDTPLHFSTNNGHVKSTEILLRKGAKLKKNGEKPPATPQVVKMAVEKNSLLLASTITRIMQDNPDLIWFTEQEKLEIIAVINTLKPQQVRMALNIFLKVATSRDSSSTPILEFLRKSLQNLGKPETLTDPTIITLVTGTVPTALQDQTMTPENYNILVSLALSVLEGVDDAGDDEDEETQRAKAAAKVLPELVNIRAEERERVSNQLKVFFPKMRLILSKPRNKELKEALQTNNSIPSEMREAMGLAR